MLIVHIHNNSASMTSLQVADPVVDPVTAKRKFKADKEEEEEDAKQPKLSPEER